MLLPSSRQPLATLSTHSPLPLQAVPVRSLPLAHDADKLHLAFALWAEGFGATVKGGGKAKAKVQQQAAGQKGQQAAGQERRPAKKAKKGK